jgi:beta-glucosidase
VALVNEGKVSKERIDDAVLRILQLKYELGLFEAPVTSAKDYPKFASAEFEKVAYDAAAESITLLKDSNNILPLKAGVKLLVTGPNANSMRTLNGGWSYSWQGEKTEMFATKYNTIFKALQNKMGAANISFIPGVEYKMNGKYYEDSIISIDAVIRAASGVDYVVLCVGENSYTEKPGDLNDLNLSENQLALINAVIKTKKPVILILNEGRPRIINKIEPYMNAIIQTYLPGNFGGDALVDIMLGNINPSGKLPYTYPRFVNAFTNYIHKPSDEQSNPQGAYDYSADYNPQYDFGFGLSYTTFSYSNLKLSKNNVNANDSITVSVNVKNTGNKAGKEVVQLFVSDLVASLSPDMKRLRGFEKINLQPDEEKSVSFTIAVKELAFVNTSNKWQLEQGTFKVAINKLHQNFELTQTTSW